jgi:hypothetical protein
LELFKTNTTAKIAKKNENATLGPKIFLRETLLTDPVMGMWLRR